MSQSENLFFENQGNFTQWLSTKEAADYLRLSENALRIMVCRKRVKAFKHYGRLRFRLEDCQSLIQPKGGI